MNQMSQWFPINLSLKNKKCVVFGAGKIAEGKISSLINSGGDVLVVSPEIKSPIIQDYIKNNKILVNLKKAEISDIDDAFIVICATDDFNTNKTMFETANYKNILVNSVDELDNSNFIFPAVLHKGDITLTVSTGGKSPLFSGVLKNILNKIIDKNYIIVAETFARYREKAYKEISNKDYRQSFFNFLKHNTNEVKIKNYKSFILEIEEQFQTHVDKKDLK